ncbi:MAG TPA: DUF4282 domain-containing protein [Gammaproteobacteria bacterium]
MFKPRDLFFFDEMLTPKVITILYWLALLYMAVTGLSVMFAGEKLTFAKFTSGLGVMVGGVIVARIASELLLAVFNINENMQSLAKRKEE